MAPNSSCAPLKRQGNRMSARIKPRQPHDACLGLRIYGCCPPPPAPARALGKHGQSQESGGWTRSGTHWSGGGGGVGPRGGGGLRGEGLTLLLDNWSGQVWGVHQQ